MLGSRILGWSEQPRAFLGFPGLVGEQGGIGKLGFRGTPGSANR